MAIITQPLWSGQELRIKLYVDGEVYVSSSIPDESNKFIRDMTFSKSEGNTSVNPMGIASSDRLSLSLYDPDDALSPANPSSPYAGKLTTGLKIGVEISDDEGTTWTPFGTYYTTNFSGGYSDGYHDMVNISAEDMLNIIGNKTVPELPVYGNITILEIIDSLYDALGLTKDQYYVDPKLNTSYLWGIVPGTKIREFVNGACQRMFARVIMDSDGVIRWIPALVVPTGFNQITLGPNDIGTLKNLTANAINYSSINVKYGVYGTEEEIEVFNRSNIGLKLGENTISDIKFNNQVLAITHVHLEYKSTLEVAKVPEMNYVAFGDGMSIKITVEDGSVYEVKIVVNGIVVSNVTKIATLKVDNEWRVGLTEYTYDNPYRMYDEEAQGLCQIIWNYMKAIMNKIQLSGTVITPHLSIGDKVVIQGTDTIYDGEYRVTAIQLKFAESYNSTVTLTDIPSDEGGYKE